MSLCEGLIACFVTWLLTFSIGKMDDKYVVLLEKVITENMRLKETMEG